MPVLLALVAAVLGWAIWKGKLRVEQLPPVILMISGAGLLARGQYIGGGIAIAIAIMWFRGVAWRLNRPITQQDDQVAIDKARFLLGVSRFDDAERIRARHRKLINENHPDRGGSDGRAAELNKARDLLLRDIDTKPR